MPTVSVIMSVYNEPIEWLQQSIRAILNQTYMDFEFIIIDDNPASKQIRNYLDDVVKDDNRVIIVPNDTNIGLTKSLNRGLSLSKGKYIARMDADDVASIDRFEKQVKYLETHEEIGLIHTNYCIIDEQGNIHEHFFLKDDRISKEWLVWTNTIAHSTVMFKSSLMNLRQPLYNESRRSSQDYDLWAFLSINDVRFAFINEELLNYRVSSKQVSRVNNKEQKSNYVDIRRKYIVSLLHKYGIINEERTYTAEELLLHIERSNYSPNSNEKIKELDLILFRLYYTVAGIKKKYVWLYFLNKRKLYSRFSIRMNSYILSQLIRNNFRPAYLF